MIGRAAADDPVPGRALEGALQVIGSIGLRTAYLALLIENPAALNHLVGLSAKSKILAATPRRTRGAARGTSRFMGWAKYSEWASRGECLFS